MTRATTTTLAVAADYADALMTARRAKNWLFILLLLILVLQLALFLLVRFNVLKLGDRAGISASDPAATTMPATVAGRSVSVAAILRYVIPATDYFGMLFVIVLSVVLMLLVMIMLVGRLIGVAHLTGAFLWSVFLIVFLFPWQALLITSENYPTYNFAGDESSARYVAPQPAFKVPGVLYTWRELEADYDFDGKTKEGFLKWGRFVAFPVLALVILMMVQTKSSRGLRFALGEADVHVDATAPPDELL